MRLRRRPKSRETVLHFAPLGTNFCDLFTSFLTKIQHRLHSHLSSGELNNGGQNIHYCAYLIIREIGLGLRTASSDQRAIVTCYQYLSSQDNKGCLQVNSAWIASMSSRIIISICRYLVKSGQILCLESKWRIV